MKCTATCKIGEVVFECARRRAHREHAAGHGLFARVVWFDVDTAVSLLAAKACMQSDINAALLAKGLPLPVSEEK